MSELDALMYGVNQPYWNFPMMNFNPMLNGSYGFYPQNYSLFNPQYSLAFQGGTPKKEEVKPEEPKEEKVKLSVNSEGDWSKIAIYETTPEKLEAYKKEYKKDETSKSIWSKVILLGSIGLSLVLGPKCIQKIGKKWTDLGKYIDLSDKVELGIVSGTAGLVVGAVGDELINNDGSTKKELVKKYLGEQINIQT